MLYFRQIKKHRLIRADVSSFCYYHNHAAKYASFLKMRMLKYFVFYFEVLNDRQIQLCYHGFKAFLELDSCSFARAHV